MTFPTIPTDKIILHHKNGDVCGYALVDLVDHIALSRFQWRLLPGKTSAYAARYTREGGKFRAILMHREILGEIAPKMVADHINSDGLDNRRVNLRVASRSQNVSNRKIGKKSTGYMKGVTFFPLNPFRPWSAQIGHNHKNHNLGYFATEKEAHAAYCAAAVSIFGAFANNGYGPIQMRDAL